MSPSKPPGKQPPPPPPFPRSQTLKSIPAPVAPPKSMPPPVAEEADTDDLDALDRLSPYEGSAPEGTVVGPIPVSLEEDEEVRIITREGGAMMASTQIAPLPQGVHATIEFDDASGPPFRVSKTVTVIGRVSSAADLVLPWNEEASRQHCAILLTKDGFFLEDLQSSNGTYVNETQVERVKLSSGDKIRIGTQVLVMRFKL